MDGEGMMDVDEAGPAHPSPPQTLSRPTMPAPPTVPGRRNLPLQFGQVSTRKKKMDHPNDDDAFTWPAATQQSPHQDLEFIRSHSAGKLKFSPGAEQNAFSPDDLEDEGEIGQGAYGTVSKMVHRESKTIMAVKRIRSTMDAREQKRLLMDLEVIMHSDDCNYIVQFYGAVFREGDCWICMELMDTSLEKLYKLVYDHLDQTMPEEIIAKITIATLKALNYLKEKLKIIHRDVKPSNILLDRRGHIKLCDFGIAGQLVDSIAKTRDAGCRPYMAPERLNLSTKYDVRSDVWSLGITLVEIANGKFPYPAWNSVFEQLQQVVHGDPPILSQPQRFTNDFVLFVNTCLTKEEANRPKYNKLLEHRFVKKYENLDINVAGYVEDVLAHAPQSLVHPARTPI